jgi:hypothetical protein
MTWADLFDRAADHEVTLSDVSAALLERRDE